MARGTKKPKPMSRADMEAYLKAAIKRAEDFIDDEIAPLREKATRYYQGQPLGNEEDGRSQIVMTEVRDVVQGMLPSLLRVFLSADHPVEFAPRRADAVQQAEQATDYVSYVFQVDNNGAKILFDVFKDALVRKTGIVKWWVDERKRVTEDTYSGINDEQVALLLGEEGIEVVEIEPEEIDEDDMQTDPVTGALLPAGPTTYKLRARRTEDDKRFVVEAVPPEEFLISPNARSEDDADYIGHRKKTLVSDLVADGYDIEDILEYGSPQPVLETNQEAQARNPALQTLENQNNDLAQVDPSLLRVWYYESYVRMDADGDGIAELHRICSIGDGGHILHDEVVSEAPFALFCPDPEPHTVIGQSIADQTTDLQDIKTNIVRNTLDSLANNIHPRTGVVEGMVNMDDVMNTEIGAIIRMRQPGMVQPLVTPFVGQQTLPILAYLDEVRAQRTGMSKASQGLDPDVLQSTTKAAVTATISAAQERLEMVARLFAETGMRRLFRGLLRMLTRNQDKARVVRLRNQWVEVDPRAWDADMDVVVNVGLGTGDKNEKIALLTQVAAKQEEALKMLGPDNPLCDMAQYRNTLGKILEVAGIKDTVNYFKVVTPQTIQQFQQVLAQNQKPDPAQILAQVERDKVMADIAMSREKLQLEKIKAAMADDRERDRIEADTALRTAEMQARYGAQVNTAQIRADMEKRRTFIDAAISIAQAETAAQQQQQQMEMQRQREAQAAATAAQQPRNAP